MFTIRTTFRIAGDEKVIATAETVYVLVDGRATDHAAFSEKRSFPQGKQRFLL